MKKGRPAEARAYVFATHTDHLDADNEVLESASVNLREVIMGSFKHPRAFYPLDLEIIDRVYEAAWARLEACEPFRDRDRDLERQEALRKQIMACATAGHIDFDDLWEKVLATFSNPKPKKPPTLPEVSA
jgi:hypothetical protein